MTTDEICKQCGSEIRGELCEKCADESDNSYEAEGYTGCVLKFIVALLVFVISCAVYAWLVTINPENRVAPSIPVTSGIIMAYYARGLYTLWKTNSTRNQA